MSRTKSVLKYLLLVTGVFAFFDCFLFGFRFFPGNGYTLIVTEGTRMESNFSLASTIGMFAYSVALEPLLAELVDK